MDTRHLRAAVTVARCGTFTQAAQELYMAQSTLSRQVLALERELGVTLFVRGPRSVALTDRGEAFMPQAEAVLRAVAGAEAAVRKTASA
jgi:DNA-binding transcriptional LysR family regulator